MRVLAEAFARTRPTNASDEDESWINPAINYFTQPQRVSPDPDSPQGGGAQGARGPDDTSWWDQLIGGLTNKQSQVPPPPTPKAPSVDQDALERSVDQSRNRTLANHDVGLITFQETKSYSNRPDSNRPIDVAREEFARAVINGDLQRGYGRPSTARPIEPSEEELRNPAVRAAYESSMRAARRAYLSPTDPTKGAIYGIQLTTPSLANYVFQGGRPEGVTLSTHSGPYTNSFPNVKVPSRTAWLNTYWDK